MEETTRRSFLGDLVGIGCTLIGVDEFVLSKMGKMAEEIVEKRKEIQNTLGCFVHYTYPYMDADAKAMQLAESYIGKECKCPPLWEGIFVPTKMEMVKEDLPESTEILRVFEPSLPEWTGYKYTFRATGYEVKDTNEKENNNAKV